MHTDRSTRQTHDYYTCNYEMLYCAVIVTLLGHFKIPVALESHVLSRTYIYVLHEYIEEACVWSIPHACRMPLHTELAASNVHMQLH